MLAKPIYKSSEGEKAILKFYNSVIKNWPIPYETLNIKTRHGDTFIIACGEKSALPMILLHGSSTNSAMWASDIIEYSRHFRVYAIDLPGEPGKSVQTRLKLKSNEHVEWLEDILNALKIAKVILIGCSMGGWISLQFATSKPEKLKNLLC